ILSLGQTHDAHDQWRAQSNQKNRADINGQKIEAGARGESDRAKKRPRGAVDREGERIDKVSPAPFAAKPPSAVAVARDHEQQPDVAERNGDNDPALQHDGSRSVDPKPEDCILSHARASENIAAGLTSGRTEALKRMQTDGRGPAGAAAAEGSPIAFGTRRLLNVTRPLARGP